MRFLKIGTEFTFGTHLKYRFLSQIAVAKRACSHFPVRLKPLSSIKKTTNNGSEVLARGGIIP